MEQSLDACILVRLLLIASQLPNLPCAPNTYESRVIIIGRYRPEAPRCYTATVKSDAFSFVPVTRMVSFTPKMSVSFIEIRPRTPQLLRAQILEGGIGIAPLKPTTLALTTEFGGRLNAEIEVYCA
ncbi:uncharacterized protein LOC128279125 [Anopheles cruzii]|uniref:uncharacterized protein LOC128279125 n=1 Tax=Anopheles cruzii TaxID=68878 RepID=UPI0022EC17E4|nr:uncharacterized protein LOC128279125 [Anopheles cruzii]